MAVKSPVDAPTAVRDSDSNGGLIIFIRNMERGREVYIRSPPHKRWMLLDERMSPILDIEAEATE